MSTCALYGGPTRSSASRGHFCPNCHPPSGSFQALSPPARFCLCPFILLWLSSFLPTGLRSLSPHVCRFAPTPKKMSLKPRLTLAFPEHLCSWAERPVFDRGRLRESRRDGPPPGRASSRGLRATSGFLLPSPVIFLPSVLRAPFNSPSALCFCLTSSRPPLLTVADSREWL